MRGIRIAGLVVAVTVGGLLNGGAAGAGPNTPAAVAAVPAAAYAAAPVPAAPRALPVAPALPAAPAPAATPAPAVSVPAVRTPAGGPTTAAVASTTVKPTPAPEKKKPAPTHTVPGTPCLATARACIDLSANRAWLIRDGAVQYGPVPITHGRKGFRTPPGTFRVSFKNRDHVSSIYDAPMPYSVFFNGGIAFHQGSLREKSHGCIHLSKKAARTFFGALDRGAVVQVVR